jgi:hypothetical protein
MTHRGVHRTAGHHGGCGTVLESSVASAGYCAADAGYPAKGGWEASRAFLEMDKCGPRPIGEPQSAQSTLESGGYRVVAAARDALTVPLASRRTVGGSSSTGSALE